MITGEQSIDVGKRVSVKATARTSSKDMNAEGLVRSMSDLRRVEP